MGNDATSYDGQKQRRRIQYPLSLINVTSSIGNDVTLCGRNAWIIFSHLDSYCKLKSIRTTDRLDFQLLTAYLIKTNSMTSAALSLQTWYLNSVNDCDSRDKWSSCFDNLDVIKIYLNVLCHHMEASDNNGQC